MGNNINNKYMSNIIVASGPVIVENNKVLLNKHGEDSFWKFCGGRVEEGEFNLKNAAKREVKEEMGLDVEILNDSPFFRAKASPNISSESFFVSI